MVQTVSAEEHTHLHVGEGKLGVKKVMRYMKALAETRTMAPGLVYARALEDCPQDVRPHLPNMATCKRNINRWAHSGNPANPKHARDLHLDGKWRETLSGEPWVLYESPQDDEERFILLGTDVNLSRYARGKMLFVDGMFDPMPVIFKQIYTFHVLEDGISTPMLFALLPRKDEQTYTKLFEVIQEACDDRGFQRPDPNFIMMDFELAVKNNCENLYPNAKVTSCYFHLNQSMVRWLKSMHYDNLPESETFNILVKQLLCLAFLREEDIVPTWKLIMDSCRTTEEKDTATYFGTTYVRGKANWSRGRWPRIISYDEPHFAIKFWNLHKAVLDAGHITNNYAEAWHRSFQGLLNRKHHTIYTFLEALKLDVNVKEIRNDQIASGKFRPSKSNTETRAAKARPWLVEYDDWTPMEILKFLVYNVPHLD